MKQINKHLKITSVFLSTQCRRRVAEVHFVYMDQFHADAQYNEGSTGYAWIETTNLPDSMHDAIDEEITDNAETIVDYLQEKFEKEKAEEEV